MADVAVVTDSIGYLPAALTDSLGIITVMSQYYDLGAGWLRESEFDGDYGLLYAQLDASKSMATTSPVTVEEFVGVFDRLLQHTAPSSRSWSPQGYRRPARTLGRQPHSWKGAVASGSNRSSRPSSARAGAGSSGWSS